MFNTSETVGLAKWIIDLVCIMFELFRYGSLVSNEYSPLALHVLSPLLWNFAVFPSISILASSKGTAKIL